MCHERVGGFVTEPGGGAAHLPGSFPVVDREPEREALTQALRAAQAREGTTWVLEGPGGIGKTRLASWLADEAAGQGFAVAWGYSQKEILSPFFPFRQIFRTLDSGPRREGVGAGPGVTLFESAKPELFWREVSSLAASHPTLVITRDRPELVHQRYPSLPASTTMLWLRRGGEGEGVISPTDLDVLGEKLSTHLTQPGHPVVAISGLEYLASQNSFLPVLRLVQFLRDSADEGEGLVLVSLNPQTLEKKEVALLEGEGSVVTEQERASVSVIPEGEPPATVLVRCLERLEQLSMASPTLLILDNVQWADGNSLQALQFLSRNIRDARVVILALRKSDDSDSEDAARALEIIDRMEEEGTARRVPLGGLSIEASRTLAEHVAGVRLVSAGANDPLARLMERMGGNPYFVQSTVQMLEDEGWIIRDGKEGRLALRPGEEESLLPETLRKALLRRLNALSDRERRLLEAAAVCGTDFDTAPIASTLSLDPEVVATILSSIEQRGRFIARGGDSGSQWRFRETLDREVILAELPPPSLRTLSTSLAAWWERNRLEDVDTLARLYHSAGDAQRGLPLLRRAIRLAIQSQLAEKVERYLRWLDTMLPAGTTPDERAREELAFIEECYVALGASPPLLSALERLANSAAGTSLDLEIVGWLCLVRSAVQPTTVVRDLDEMDRVFEAHPGAASPRAEALRLDVKSHVALHSGQYETAYELAKDLLVLSRAITSRRLEANALYRLGWVEHARGHHEDALTLLRQLREVIAAGEPPVEMLKVANLTGVFAWARGDLPATVAAFREAVDLARKHGQTNRLISNMLNLGQALGEMGRWSEEEAMAREALGLARRFNMRVPEALADLGRSLVRQERYAEALPVLGQADERIRSEGALDLAAACRIETAEAHLALGNLEQARSDLSEAEPHLDTLVGERGRFYILKARLLATGGDVAGARSVLEAGLTDFHSRGNQLEESRLRTELTRYSDRKPAGPGK